MNAKLSAFATTLVVSASVLTASADAIDRPNGFKIGERMTLRPYVSLSYTYDSNVDSTKHAKDGSSWVVNPGLGAEYKGENWEIAGRAWYRYHAYNHYSKQLNTSSYGETLTFKWADSLPNEKGWSVLLSESFTQISQDDDMSNYSGRGLGRDRKTFQTAGIIERRINERLHAALEASYYLLDYDNDVKKYAPLYGWKRALVGGEAGYAASKWTDIILAANYGWYWDREDRVSHLDRLEPLRVRRRRCEGHQRLDLPGLRQVEDLRQVEHDATRGELLPARRARNLRRDPRRLHQLGSRTLDGPWQAQRNA